MVVPHAALESVAATGCMLDANRLQEAAMSDKPVAGITTAIIALPLVILCCLGPAFLLAGLGGLIGWFGGANILLTVSMAIVAGIAVNRFLRRRIGGPRTSDATDHAETGESIKDWPVPSTCCPSVPSEMPATEPPPVNHRCEYRPQTISGRKESATSPKVVHRVRLNPFGPSGTTPQPRRATTIAPASRTGPEI